MDSRAPSTTADAANNARHSDGRQLDSNTADDSLDGYNPSDSELIRCVELLNQIWPPGESEPLETTVTLGAETPTEEGSETLPAEQELAFGRFKIVKQLGQGGCGIVFLAYDQKLKREVALKIPQPRPLEEAGAWDRFRREAEAVALLDHPGIVPVYDVGELGSASFIVSAYCRGLSLASWLQQTGIVAPRLVAMMMRQLTSAVAHAHERGVLHRDLKPDNVLLDENTNPDSELGFVPKLTDFGLAKFVDRASANTLHGTLIGTIGYMSPEQAAGDLKQVGVQTDVYALGAMLYELLAGKQLFSGEYLEVLRRIQQEDPSGLDDVRPAIPQDLINICYKALEKDRSSRYQSARELEADLVRFLEGKPVVARPLSSLEYCTRWIRRHPAVSVLAASLLLVATLGFAGIVWQWQRANLQADAVQQEARRAQTNLAQSEDSLYQFAWMTLESGQWMEPGDAVRGGKILQLTSYLGQIMHGELPRSLRQPIMAAQAASDARCCVFDGNHQGALEAYEVCLSVWRQAVTQSPENTTYRRAFALCLYCAYLSAEKLGLDASAQRQLVEARETLRATARTGPFTEYVDLLADVGDSLNYHRRSTEALDTFRRALQECETLLAGEPQETAYRYRIAAFHFRIGELEFSAAQPQIALSDLHASQAILTGLLPVVPHDDVTLQLVSDVQLRLGTVHYQLHDYDTAGKEFQQGLKIAQSAVDSGSQDNRWPGRLAWLHEKIADNEWHADHVSVAAEHYQAAAGFWKRALAVGLFSDQDFSRWEKACFDAANAYLKSGQPLLAKSAAQNAIEVYALACDKIREPRALRVDLAGCYALLGDIERSEEHFPEALAAKQEAAKLYREMLDRSPRNATAPTNSIRPRSA